MSDNVGIQIFDTLLRFIHIASGITWIGMLYYFNFVQTPFFGTELGGQARGLMMRGMVPSAMWWFRWGAMFTFGSGWIYLGTRIHLDAYSPQAFSLILSGATFGTLMWANVWFVIWPIQKIAIASAEAVAAKRDADPRAAARAPIAGRASRTNTLFSLPMLFFMIAGSNHAAWLVPGDPAKPGIYWAALLAIIVLLELNIFYGSAATQKPLATVKGVIHLGLVIVVVGALLANFLL